jgi:hypothetical protein
VGQTRRQEKGTGQGTSLISADVNIGDVPLFLSTLTVLLSAQAT